MAFLRANIAPELQDAAVAAIADTIGETAATRPAEAHQVHHQQPSQGSTPSPEAAHRPY